MTQLTRAPDGTDADGNAELVIIVDSRERCYVSEPDIERSILEPACQVELLQVGDAEELIGAIDEADGIISWHTIPLGGSVLESARKCRGIVRAAVGFDNIDVEMAAQLGIPVSIIPDYGTEEVADHALAVMLSLARNLRGVARHAADGGWDWRAIGTVARLRDLPVGIIGFGRIGRAVARRAQAFGMAVGFYDPYVASGVEKAHAVRRFESLDELLRSSRIITIHVPLTDETRGMLGAPELARLSSETILINTARGGVIDQDALIESVVTARIGRVGLDVLADEPHVPEELRSSDRVLLTAHSAFFSDASLLELRYKAAGVLSRLMSGQPHRDVVNGLQHIASYV